MFKFCSKSCDKCKFQKINYRKDDLRIKTLEENLNIYPVHYAFNMTIFDRILSIGKPLIFLLLYIQKVAFFKVDH